MRYMNVVFLTTANVLTSIIVIGLGINLFGYLESDLSIVLQTYQGIYLIFILLGLCEIFKWLAYIKFMQFALGKMVRFLMIYGIFIVIIGVIYQFYYISLPGLLYLISYYLLNRIPEGSNVIVEKKVEGKELASNVLFHPIEKRQDKK